MLYMPLFQNCNFELKPTKKRIAEIIILKLAQLLLFLLQLELDIKLLELELLAFDRPSAGLLAICFIFLEGLVCLGRIVLDSAPKSFFLFGHNKKEPAVRACIGNVESLLKV